MSGSSRIEEADLPPLPPGEVRLRIDVLTGQKTGAFLDQRENHVRAGEYARGRALEGLATAVAAQRARAFRADHLLARHLGPLALLGVALLGLIEFTGAIVPDVEHIDGEALQVAGMVQPERNGLARRRAHDPANLLHVAG